MKRIIGLGLVMLIAMLTGCSLTNGYVGHSIMTEVQLNQANFDVIKSVTGEAQANYFLGIGPSEQDLYGRAKRDMLNKAQLKGSQAMINVTTDTKLSGFIFWRQQKVYVSGEVIQFNK